MTSGQMAPTTLIDQVTTTTPFGRKPEVHGYPINVCELLSTLEGAVYVERVSVHDIKNIMNAKKAIKKAFKVQMANLGSRLLKCCHPVRQTGIKSCGSIEMDRGEDDSGLSVGQLQRQGLEV